jgi:hypothetical protein
MGLTLGDFLTLQSALCDEPGRTTPAADSVIMVFLPGGMSHIDSFDPKPNAAVEIRGEMGHVKTNTGEVFGGLLRQAAGVADKIAVIRSFTHTEAAHERGQHSMITGQQPSAAIPYVCVPTVANEWAGTGYLPSSYGPFGLGSDPAAADFRVRDLSSPAGVNEARSARQRTLLKAVDDHFRTLESSEALDAMDSFYERAYSLLSSAHARNAFNIAEEDPKLRDQYGRHAIGQRLLMARRLVEAGVRFVTVDYGGWDFHKQIRDGMRATLPPLDQAFAMLIRDLESRGLLGRTLVIVSTEFGRTPRLNRDAGRDHWPKVFSIAMAGGGVKGGTIIGKSDPTGSEPADQPVQPADMAATIFTQLGIDPSKKLSASNGRPFDLVRHGQVISGLV